MQKHHVSSRIRSFTIGADGLQDLRFTKIYTAAYKIYGPLWALDLEYNKRM